MRVLVTGGAGFIGSHFAKRLAAAGHEVVVLDKLTYSGNKANLDGVDVELVVGDICDAEAVARAGAGCEAVVNFAAETHVDRSILGAAEFIETDVHGTYVLLGWARDAGVRLVQVSTDEVYGDVPEGQSSREDRPAAAVEPVLGVEGRRRPAGARRRAHVRDRRLRHARREHIRPEPVPREADPALRHQRSRRRAAARLRRRPAAARVASRRGPLRGGRARPPRGRGRARSTTSAARSTRTWRSPKRILELTGGEPATSSATSRTGPVTTGATRSTTPSCVRSAGRRRIPSAEAASAETVEWYRAEPPLVGADQERRVPAVLRRAVRRPAPLNPCKRREGQLA